MHYRNLVHQAARQHHDRVAVVCGDVERTYAEVLERASRLANALAERGLLRGDRVAVLLPNCAEYMEVDVGLALAGFVRVSLNVRATARQQIDVLDDSGARVLIYADELAEMAGAMLADPTCPVEHVVRVGGDAPADGDALDYERTLAAASPEPPAVDPRPCDLDCLFYTSGTTGRPKGVMLRHGAYMAVALQLLVEFGPVEAGDSIVLTQPLSHGGGFFMLPWFVSGATCVVMDRFEPGACLELAERHAAQTVKVVPTMLLQLLAHGGDGRDLPALRRFIYGASPMPAKQLGDLIDRYGLRFAQLYGQAESPMCITVLADRDHADPALLGSVGRPWRGLDVRVVDERGRDVEPGTPGEVIVRGPHLMSGYWRQPALTRTVLVDGWVHTRDMAQTDERGFVYLLGRTDDMIISGGFNIAPRVVEEVLNRHPAILESFVLGTPHETMGQEVTAFVSLRPGTSAAADDIIEFARPELGYQKPRRVQLVERLPRNAYGKVAKAELLDLVAAPQESGA